jgi:thiol-disulfide isomerase/thioredoxin
MTDEQKELQTQMTYVGVLFDGEAYGEFFKYLKAHPNGLDLSFIQRMYLLASIRTGDINKAFSFLNLLASQETELYQWLLSDDELEPLRQDDRWENLLVQYKYSWEMSRENRRAETLSRKINKPAPLWELLDVEGNVIRLADLKGRILILDFWATWCGPCQKAMTVLNNWVKNEIPIGVEVYSINVWENDPETVAAFMIDNDYAMTLLYGTDNLSTAYGFDGIPYLCVIDRDGNIRFEEKGYVEDLAENLTFWVEDLN